MKQVCLPGGLSWGRVVTGQGGSTLDSAAHLCAQGHVLTTAGRGGGRVQGTTDRTEDLQGEIPGSGGDLPPRTVHGPDSPAHYPHQPRAPVAASPSLSSRAPPKPPDQGLQHGFWVQGWWKPDRRGVSRVAGSTVYQLLQQPTCVPGTQGTEQCSGDAASWEPTARCRHIVFT